MPYGFNDDKSKVSVPTLAQFQALQNSTLKVKVITEEWHNLKANGWTATTIDGIPATSVATIPYLVYAASNDNPSTIWVSGISIYLKDTSTPTAKTLVMSNARSERVNITFKVVCFYT